MSMEKINVAAVSYLNTKPFLYGLEHSDIINHIELSQEIPSVIAEKLVVGQVSIGLLPTAALAEIAEPQIIGDYCIGSDGEVGSVCIYSSVPIEEITHLYLDYQSRSSVELGKLLLKEFWKINPQLIAGSHGYENKITNRTAGLMIGDRALMLKKNFQYSYDLGKAWKDFADLPFVYACWVASAKLSTPFINAFNDALKLGVTNAESVARQSQFFYPGIDTIDYLTRKIKYEFTDSMKQGMEAFLEHLKITEKVI